MRMYGERLSFLWRDILWWWIKIFFGLPLRLFFRIQSRDKRLFPPPGKAAFLIGNHSNILDPFFGASFINRPICYVVGDDDLRYKFIRTILSWIKVIPKTKNVPDFVTMRMLLKAVKDGEIIGIAPEGSRNWDGETLPLNETIPRLVKKLKIPVICIKLRGAYLSWPRWSPRPRRGKMILQFSYLFEDPRKVPDNENQIKRMIEEEIRYSELEDEEITNYPFGCRKAAEHLELRLWLCPNCKNFFGLQSRDKHFFCKHCGARWEFKGNGTFILRQPGMPLVTSPLNFKRYIDWTRWNDAETLFILRSLKARATEPLVSLPARMWVGQAETLRSRDFILQGKGTASLTPDFRMLFNLAGDDKYLLDVPLVEVKGAHVAKNDRFEFFLSGMAYRFTFFGLSAYFWHFLSKRLGES